MNSVLDRDLNMRCRMIQAITKKALRYMVLYLQRCKKMADSACRGGLRSLKQAKKGSD